jgi:transcriptional regulator with XRE-family HTH domain
MTLVKPAVRSYSRYARDAARLLGQEIRVARLEKGITIEELAARAGLSRGLVHRIEQGDLGCSIGAVFETAAILGIRLFDADLPSLAAHVSANNAILTLLPQAARAFTTPVKDDF